MCCDVLFPLEKVEGGGEEKSWIEGRCWEVVFFSRVAQFASPVSARPLTPPNRCTPNHLKVGLTAFTGFYRLYRLLQRTTRISPCPRTLHPPPLQPLGPSMSVRVSHSKSVGTLFCHSDLTLPPLW